MALLGPRAGRFAPGRRRLVGDQQLFACEPLIALNEVLHALRRPTAVALRRDALAREPIRDLTKVLAHLPYRSSDVGAQVNA